MHNYCIVHISIAIHIIKD